MKAKVLINIFLENKIWFDLPLIKKAKETLKKNEVFFDLDNYSDKDIIGYAVRLVEESENIIVIFNIEGGFSEQVLQVIPLLNKIRRSRNKVSIYQLGESDWLEQQINRLRVDSYLKFRDEQSLLTKLSEK